MVRKSTSAYPADWKEIARTVKVAAGWRCVRCGHPHDPAAGYCLTVHHLDMSPEHSDPEVYWWNLAPLCQRCHLQIQAKVIMERVWYLPHSAWFAPYAAGYYAHVYGFPTDRAFVLANVERLIAIGQGRLEA